MWEEHRVRFQTSCTKEVQSPIPKTSCRQTEALINDVIVTLCLNKVGLYGQVTGLFLQIMHSNPLQNHFPKGEARRIGKINMHMGRSDTCAHAQFGFRTLQNLSNLRTRLVRLLEKRM